MTLNEHQQRALKLLKKMTSSTVKKRVQRDLNLLSTSDTGIEYTLFPDQWREWCVGWAFPIIPAFAAALDIQLTERVKKCFKEDGKTPILDEKGKQRTKRTLVWTQGSAFNFCAGYTMYEVPEAWTLSWGSALQYLQVALQVKSSIAAEPATATTPRNAGTVVYCLYRPNAQKSAVELCETCTVTQDEFVEILIGGLPTVILENQWDENMASVHLTNTLKCYDAALRPIEFCGTKFCLTGEFALGSREAVEKAIVKRGGTCLKNPLASGCILVVGTIASDGWAYGDYGTKIENAMYYRENGNPVRIINEDFFVAELLRNDALNLPLSVKPICPKKPNLDILAGLASGMIADGTIVQEEADFLLQWLKNNASLHAVFPVSVLLPRVEKVLCDGVLDKNEAKELFDMLKVVSENIK